jgi:hypothetical protein
MRPQRLETRQIELFTLVLGTSLRCEQIRCENSAGIKFGRSAFFASNTRHIVHDLRELFVGWLLSHGQWVYRQFVMQCTHVRDSSAAFVTLLRHGPGPSVQACPALAG